MRKRHVLIFGCKHDMFCRLTFEVCSKRMLSTCFVFAQQYIISGGKCAVSEREICPKVEKNEIWAECTDQKLINNLSLAWQFCLNGCQTSNVYRTFSISAIVVAVIAAITGKWFPYDCYDCCNRWTFFLSDRSDHKDHSDHMETRLYWCNWR